MREIRINRREGTMIDGPQAYAWPAEGRDQLRGAIADNRGTPEELEVILEGEPVYSVGWNRHWFPTGIRQAELAAYAATMAGRPILYGHRDDPDYRIGHGGPGSVAILGVPHGDGTIHDTPGLVQDIHLTTPRGWGLVTHGGSLSWSINPFDTPETKAWCSICGAEWPSAECGHRWGDTDPDGSQFMVLLSGLQHGETSATAMPAALGTGDDARSVLPLAADPVMPPGWVRCATRVFRATAAELTALTDVSHRLDEARGLVAQYDERIQAFTAEVARLNAECFGLNTTNAAMAERLEALESSRARDRVIAIMRAKGLRGTVADHIAEYRANPDQYERHFNLAPDSLLTQVVSGAPPDPPDESETETKGAAKWQALHDKCNRMAAETGRPLDEIWIAERNKLG